MMHHTILPFPSYYLLSMLLSYATIDTNATGDPSIEYGSSPAASEAVYIPYDDGSSSDINCRMSWYHTEYTFNTHSSGHRRRHAFNIRTYTSYRRVYCRYCNSWGWLGGTTSIFMYKSYNFYIRMRVDIGVCHAHWHVSTPTTHHTTIK